jgi:hypothetical protein
MSERGKYTPSAEHRFIVSPDVNSQGRLQATIALRHHLKRLSFFTEATLSGSLVKGRDLASADDRDADIDLRVFLNDAQVRRHQSRYLQQNAGLFRMGGLPPISRNSILPLLGELIPAITPLTEEASRTQNTRLVVAENIRAGMKRHFAIQRGDLYALMHREKPIVFVDTQVFTLAQNGPDSILGSLMQLLYYPQTPEEDNAKRVKIATFFGYELGPGLQPYKARLFRQLEQHRDGHELWRHIAQIIVDHERYDKIPAAIKDEFPDNLTDAKVYYLRKSCRLPILNKR